MTLAVDGAPPRMMRAWRRRGAPFGLSLLCSDAVALAALALLWTALFLLRWDALPMQLWDESRNANNALELALHGRWLAPTYAGVVDHWNTKPPLLIWCIAALLKLGAPPLVALRLTSWLAAAATTAAIWSVLRWALKDRLAAFVGGVLLLSAWAYVGEHGARTGDYDALESLFILCGTLAAWRAVQAERASWLSAAALAFGLGVMTKGVAALLPGPGLALFALSRPSTFAKFLRDGRTWLAAGLFLLVAGGYYALRGAMDPGYLRAVAGNELGGRFLEVTENHRGSWHFYITQLALFDEPCAALCALGLLPLFGRDTERRALVLAAGAAAGSLLVVLSVSKSKMAWYITPMAPLLAVIAAVGVSDALRWLEERRPALSSFARGGLALVLLVGAACAVWSNQTDPQRTWGELGGSRFGYGGFLEAVRVHGPGSRLAILDGGFRNDAGYADYDPMLKFWADVEGTRGLKVEVIHTPAALHPGEAVGTCDAAVWRPLADAYAVRPLLVQGGCRLVRLVAARQGSR